MSSFQNSFIQEIIKYKAVSKSISIVNFIVCFICFYLVLITPRGMNKLSISLVGMLTGISGVSISKVNSNLDTRLNDLGLTSRVSSKELLGDYLTDKQQITVEVTFPPMEEREMIDNIIDYWLKSDKHLMIIGGTGDGKSTAIKHFISRLNDWDITAFDVDYSKGDYPDKVQIKYDYDSISSAMNNEVEELEQRISDRRSAGKNYSAKPKLTIAEELPALALEIGEDVSKWIRVKSSRGRKVYLKLACLAQNDTAENIALKGNVALRDNNFILLYLGKKAIDKAKKDKDEQLISWLQSTSHGRGILDGKPCLININSLPNTSEVTSNHLLNDSSKLESEAAESADIYRLQQSEAQNIPLPSADNLTDLGNILEKSDEEKIAIALKLKSEGYSKTKIIKLLWGIDGGVRFTELSKMIDNG